MTYINMRQKEDFLNDVECAIKMICTPLKNNIQPTSSSVEHKPIVTNKTSASHYNAANALPRIIKIPEKIENDGNNHKLGKFIRAKANILIEITENLSNIDKPFVSVFDQIPINSKWFSKTNMSQITNQIQDMIFKKDIEKLKPVPKKYLVK